MGANKADLTSVSLALSMLIRIKEIEQNELRKRFFNPKSPVKENEDILSKISPQRGECWK